jgi:hypothetical protein
VAGRGSALRSILIEVRGYCRIRRPVRTFDLRG